jgi:molecular chaperone GrpE (heat shock protein)
MRNRKILKYIRKRRIIDCHEHRSGSGTTESSSQRFKAKLKYDAHKERIIDHLHQELQAYKNDIVKKHVQSLIMDLIKIIDDARKFTEHYRTKEPSLEDIAKLLDFLDHIPSDLEDILLWQGIKSFAGGESALILAVRKF